MSKFSVKRAIPIIFMLLVASAILFLLAAGAYRQPSYPNCSAKSCDTRGLDVSGNGGWSEEWWWFSRVFGIPAYYNEEEESDDAP